jgi:hypothetical protein
MNETCGLWDGDKICGKPAVEHADLRCTTMTNQAGWVRLWLCAYHYDRRKEILAAGPSASPIPFNPFD